MFHATHRDRLYAASDGALIVLTAYDAMQQSGDMAAPFLQQSSFWWLTGIEEPGWKLILDTARKHATLVRPAQSEIDRVFNGGLDDTAIITHSGIKKIIAAKEFETQLAQLARHHTVVKTIDPKTETHEFVANPALHELHATLSRIFPSVQDCSGVIAALRAVKQAEEIARMRHAITMTCRAFQDVAAMLGTLKTEAAVEAEFVYRFHAAGATHAYQPIVASADHACTLHYTRGDGKIRSRDMVVIDIGARFGGYSADITRTYCLNPTKRQQQVHAAVEHAHKEIIALIQPSILVADYIAEVDAIMKRALQDLGLLKDSTDNETYRRYFPHAVSHGLGIDTHDSLGKPRSFVPGMVITVEPGIYIPEESIGVRIEDDILVTKTGHENLSRQLSTALIP